MDPDGGGLSSIGRVGKATNADTPSAASPSHYTCQTRPDKTRVDHTPPAEGRKERPEKRYPYCGKLPYPPADASDLLCIGCTSAGRRDTGIAKDRLGNVDVNVNFQRPLHRFQLLVPHATNMDIAYAVTNFPPNATSIAVACYREISAPPPAYLSVPSDLPQSCFPHPARSPVSPPIPRGERPE